MLTITIEPRELYDETSGTFVTISKPQTIKLEHSLVSLSKWESKWHKAFMSKEPKTLEETIDYVRCMTITQNVDPMVYYALTEQNFKEITEYIENPMTATWFEKDHGAPSREVITNELIYYWMVALRIPFDCEKWHLNRLMTLIRVCSIKNQPPKKMSKAQILSRNRALNEARKKKLNTRG